MGTEVRDAVHRLCDDAETRALAYVLPPAAAVVAWDTETTGLNGVVVQLGVVVLDAARNELASSSRLLAPVTGFPIEPRALAVHKISRERQCWEGEPVAKCLRAFEHLVRTAKSRGVPVVAHNAAFDKRMLRNTARAVGYEPSEAVESLCTMMLGTLAVPHADGKRGKRLKNRELYERLVGEAPEDERLHDAVEDARLTAHSFLVGRDRGLW